MVDQKKKLGAVVLCGGKSARMGWPKAMLQIDGRPLLARVVDAVSAAAGPVVVCAAPDQTLPDLQAGVLVVRDTVADAGPLAAVAQGIDSLKPSADLAFVCACDMPFLSAELINVLRSALHNAQAAVPKTAGQTHPLAAVYRVEVVDHARKLLRAGKRSMHALLDALNVQLVDEPTLARGGVRPEALCNVNTPEDWQRVAGR